MIGGMQAASVEVGEKCQLSKLFTRAHRSEQSINHHIFVSSSSPLDWWVIAGHGGSWWVMADCQKAVGLLSIQTYCQINDFTILQALRILPTL